MSGAPLHQKLRLEAGQTAVVINCPVDYTTIVNPLPEGIEISVRSDDDADVVHLFVRDRSELLDFIDEALNAVKFDGLLWISYPKGSSGVDTDINRDSMWELLLKKGIRPVTQISVNATWSAIRFRPEDRVGA